MNDSIWASSPCLTMLQNTLSAQANSQRDMDFKVSEVVPESSLLETL